MNAAVNTSSEMLTSHMQLPGFEPSSFPVATSFLFTHILVAAVDSSNTLVIATYVEDLE